MTTIALIIHAFQTLTDAALATRPKGGSFKVKIYKQVIGILGKHDGPLESVDHGLAVLRAGGMKLSGEREGGPYKSKILLKIHELLTTGRLEAAEKAAANPHVLATKELTRIPGVGPAKASELIANGIDSLDSLEKAVEAATLAERDPPLNRMQTIGFRHYRDLEERIPREEMREWSEYLAFLIEQTEIEVHASEVVGSYRRGAANSGDIDFQICLPRGADGPEQAAALMDTIRDFLVGDGAMREDDIWSHGNHKLMAVVRRAPSEQGGKARHLDIWVFTQEQYPFALLYATGSATFNIEMRNHALKNGWSLSDKGLRLENPNGRPPSVEECRECLGKEHIETEADIFQFLGVEWVEPDARTNFQAKKTT